MTANGSPPRLGPEAQAAHEALRSLVGQLRRRLVVQAAVAWAGWFGVAVSAAFLCALAALAAGAQGVHASWIAGTILALGLTSCTAAVGARVWFEASSPWPLARRVDAGLGSDAVRCSLELVGEAESGRLEHPWSRARLERHLVATGSSASRLAVPALTPWTRSARLSALGPAALILCLGLTHVPRVQQWLQRWSPAAGAALLARPPGGLADVHLRDVTIELTPPPYTHEAPGIISGGSGSFAALPGTRVLLEATAPGALDAVAFQVGDGPWQSGEVSGDSLALDFVVGQERSYRLRGELAAGGEPIDSGPLDILPRDDRPPRARVVAPPADVVLLDAGEVLELLVEARDDFGLTRIERVLRREGMEESRSVVHRFDEPARSGRPVLAWSPGADVAGGDLELLFEVFDNDTVGGPKGSFTGAVRVRVMTGADRHALALASLSDLLDQTLGALGETLLWQEQLPGDSAAHEARVVEQMELLLTSAAELREALRKDSRTAALDHATVGSLVDDVSRAWDRVRLQLRRDHPLSPGSDPVVEHVHALERAALLLDRQLSRERWRAAEATARDASAAMQRLQAALESGDQAAIDEAMREVRALMAQLDAQMANMADGPALEMANPGERGEDLLQQLASLLEQGRVDEAMALLERTSSSLAQMQGGGEDASEILARLEEAIAEVTRLEAEQGRTNQTIEALVRDHPEAAVPEGLDGLQERSSDLATRGQQLGESGLSDRLAGAVEGGLRRHGEYLDGARRALAQGELDRAIEGVARADGELIDVSQLARMFHEVEASGLDEATHARWQRELSKLEGEHLQLIESILDEENRWRGARADAAVPGAQAAAGQRAIARDVARLDDDLEREVSPMLGDSVQRGMLQGAGQMMEAAAGDLELGRTQRAQSHGRDAGTRLEQVRQHLEQLQEMVQRSGDSSGLSLGAMAGWNYFEGSASGRVEIPAEEDSDRLEALRRAALAAAAEDAPPSYRSHNSAYYEELVH